MDQKSVHQENVQTSIWRDEYFIDVPLFFPKGRKEYDESREHFQPSHEHIPGKKPFARITEKTEVFTWSDVPKSRAYIHERCDDRTH